jgi:hypothetical protein
MSHYLLAASPLLGHLMPMMRIGQHLAQRGHQVDDISRARYLAAYGTCWGIAQTLGPLAWTHLLSVGVPVAWLIGAALCVLLTVLVPFAGRAINLAGAAQRLPTF